MCGTPGRRWRAAPTLVRAAGGTVIATAEIYDRMEAIVDAGRAELRARRIQGARELSRRRLSAVPIGRADRVVLSQAPRAAGARCGRRSTICTVASITCTRPPIPSTSSAGSRDPADREVVGFCAAGLAFGRVASVLQSIESLLARDGAAAGGVRARASTRPRERRGSSRWCIAGFAAATWSRCCSSCSGCCASHGSIEAFFAAGDDPAAPDVARRSIRSRRARCETDLRAAYGPRLPTRAGVCYFFPRPSGRQRLQAAQPVSALDGSPRRDRPRRVAVAAAVAADRAARHARHPARPVPAADAPRQPGLEDGRRTSRRRCGRIDPAGPGALRLLAVPRRHDERVRLQPRAARLAVPAARRVPTARS